MNKGDRVRVTFDTEIAQVLRRSGGSNHVHGDNGVDGEYNEYLVKLPFKHISTTEGLVLRVDEDSVEKLAPVYEIGRVYKTSGGALLRRAASGWEVFGAVKVYSDDYFSDNVTFTKVLDENGDPL